MDLKYIENRVEGLTRHLLALADEARHVIARADAQVGDLAREAVPGGMATRSAARTERTETTPSIAMSTRAETTATGTTASLQVAAGAAASRTMSGLGSGAGVALPCGQDAATALNAMDSSMSLTLTSQDGMDVPAPPQTYPHTITLCLEPLRERTEEALSFLYEDRKAVHRGITYLDYPGSDRAEKRMNFAMFRRGLHGFNRHCEGLEGRALKQRLFKLSEQNRENGKKHKGTKRPRD